jgi:hypothetical protein
MVKFIEIDSIVTPDFPGYGDKAKVYLGNDLRFESACSACPNPYRPSDNTPWQRAYGWLALGEYLWECMESVKHGKCLRLADGWIVPARLPNVNHDGRAVLDGVEVHRGDSMTWRGSAGCLTLPPNIWAAFISLFDIGDTGAIRIMDASREVAA